MSEGVTIADDFELAELALRMRIEQARVAALIGALGEARATHMRARWALVDRLVALEKERPGARWRAGDKVYWLEDARLCSEHADPR